MASFFVGALQWLIEAVAVSVIWVINFFPDSPFSSPSIPPASINLGWITWLFDFPTWIAHFTVILSCILVYYGVKLIARWLKVIKS